MQGMRQQPAENIPPTATVHIGHLTEACESYGHSGDIAIHVNPTGSRYAARLSARSDECVVLGREANTEQQEQG